MSSEGVEEWGMIEAFYLDPGFVHLDIYTHFLFSILNIDIYIYPISTPCMHAKTLILISYSIFIFLPSQIISFGHGHSLMQY